MVLVDSLDTVEITLVCTIRITPLAKTMMSGMEEKFKKFQFYCPLILFEPQSVLIKPVSPIYIFSVNFTSFIGMHLLGGPYLGHYMIYYDGKLEKER